jgi:hypothetical protein
MEQSQANAPQSDIEALVDAGAAAIGLPIAADHRPGVLLNFGRIAAMAAIVMAHPLADETEPAPVFRHDRP